jgi:hypothetical protein
VCKLCVGKLNDTTQLIAEIFATYDSFHEVSTFISESSILNKVEHGFTDKTLILFEAMTGIRDISSICRLCVTQHKPFEMPKIVVGAFNPFEKKIRSVFHIKVGWYKSSV